MTSFTCPICELEIDSVAINDLPPTSAGCLHRWEPIAPTSLVVAPKPQSRLASSLQKEAQTQKPHLIVEARAGTGKTFTLVVGVVSMFRDRCEGLWETLKAQLGFDPIPTPQQAKVWESMALSADARTIQFTAFNKSIVREFEQKWGWVIASLKTVDVNLSFSTNHSMGFAAVRKAFPRINVSEYRVMDLISGVLNKDIRELRRQKFEMLKGVERLVSLCKMNLLDGCNSDELQRLASHHDLDIDGYRGEIFDLVPKVLALCKDPSKDCRIDYDDMIWLPVVQGLSMARNDLLLVDECQDLNRCQQALAKAAGRRLILVGDPKQAIYGFAGADTESMPRMFEELSKLGAGCHKLPLTMTRRCGKAIVKKANELVPDFEAFESNPEGEVLEALYPTTEKDGKTQERPFEKTYLALVKSGDMVLCRVNAPLVSQCFRFLKRGIKANIQGRDVGQGLKGTIDKLNAVDLLDLIRKIGDWLEVETSKERAKKFPSESRVIALQDRHDCLLAFASDIKLKVVPSSLVGGSWAVEIENPTPGEPSLRLATFATRELAEEGKGRLEVSAVLKRIETIFTDDRSGEGIRLSSIHKAKGLEARRVFILQPKGASIPHPMAKSKWQVEQEYNLLYVATTRAIEQLYFVR